MERTKYYILLIALKYAILTNLLILAFLSLCGIFEDTMRFFIQPKIMQNF